MDYGYLATQGSDLQEDLLSHYFHVHLKYCQVLFDDLIRWQLLLKNTGCPKALAQLHRKTDPSSEKENRDRSSHRFPAGLRRPLVHISVTPFSCPHQINARADSSIRDSSVDLSCSIPEPTIHKLINGLLRWSQMDQSQLTREHYSETDPRQIPGSGW